MGQFRINLFPVFFNPQNILFQHQRCFWNSQSISVPKILAIILPFLPLYLILIIAMYQIIYILKFLRSHNIYLTMFEKLYDKAKNAANNVVMGASKKLYPPPETDQFEENGKLSPDEFKRAGDKLTEVCSGWKWMPSSNPNYSSKYLDEKKQYLILEKALCKSRISVIPAGTEERVEGEDGEEVVILHSPEQKEEEINEENFRYYTMYIIYDEYYHTPRIFFSATDFSGNPVPNEKIKEDIQKEYLDKTLTMEPFNFIDNLTMPTVHPCKHAEVLKSMSDRMRENGQKVQSHFALLIFLKFIPSIIPTVEFDLTGDLYFE